LTTIGYSEVKKGHRGHDCMVVDLQLPVQSVPITTKVIISNLPMVRCIHDSQVGFFKKSSFKESSGILLVFSPTYLFILFHRRWIQKSILAIRKMSLIVSKWRTKWLPKKTTFENKPYSALFINGPYESRNVGIKLYFRYKLYFCLYHMVSPPSVG
jgi:hypothetical protein